MKNIHMKLIIVLTAFAFLSAGQVSAQGIGSQVKEEVKDMVKDQKEDRLELKNELKDRIMERTASRVGAIKEFFSQRAFLNRATIMIKGENQFTAEKDGKQYTINISSDTKYRRRFLGDSDFDELKTGHIVSIYGKWVDEDRTEIEALSIRDLSIQRRLGVFVGEVSEISGNDITINTIHRGSIKATVSGSTGFVNRKMQSISLSDVEVGHKIRIKGLYDNYDSTVSEVKQVKDYSLPPKVTPSVSAAPTATPTP